MVFESKSMYWVCRCLIFNCKSFSLSERFMCLRFSFLLILVLSFALVSLRLSAFCPLWHHGFGVSSCDFSNFKVVGWNHDDWFEIIFDWFQQFSFRVSMQLLWSLVVQAESQCFCLYLLGAVLSHSVLASVWCFVLGVKYYLNVHNDMQA